jgi:hypothetical protein
MTRDISLSLANHNGHGQTLVWSCYPDQAHKQLLSPTSSEPSSLVEPEVLKRLRHTPQEVHILLHDREVLGHLVPGLARGILRRLLSLGSPARCLCVWETSGPLGLLNLDDNGLRGGCCGCRRCSRCGETIVASKCGGCGLLLVTEDLVDGGAEGGPNEKGRDVLRLVDVCQGRGRWLD